jgi:hypothetical protein
MNLPDTEATEEKEFFPGRETTAREKGLRRKTLFDPTAGRQRLAP